MLTALSMVGTACGGDEAEPGVVGDQAQVSPSPGVEGLLDDEPTPSPGGDETPAAEEAVPGEPEGEPPPPGQATATDFEVVAQGTDPAEGRFLPTVLLARTPEQGAAAAAASPAPGAAEVIRDWNQYQQRAVVAVLGGSQPDPAHSVTVQDVNVVEAGTWLLAFGRIGREKGPAAQVISVPWVVLALPAADVDVVTRCTISLEAATTPFTNPCPAPA